MQPSSVAPSAIRPCGWTGLIRPMWPDLLLGVGTQSITCIEKAGFLKCKCLTNQLRINGQVACFCVLQPGRMLLLLHASACFCVPQWRQTGVCHQQPISPSPAHYVYAIEARVALPKLNWWRQIRGYAESQHETEQAAPRAASAIRPFFGFVLCCLGTVCSSKSALRIFGFLLCPQKKKKKKKKKGRRRRRKAPRM